MKGKLIVIEGTDCSGKETQTKMLIGDLNLSASSSIRYTFPDYDTPTGKIIGLPYLGKSYIAKNMIDEIKPRVMDKLSVYTDGKKHDELITNIIFDEVSKYLGEGWFSETAPLVDAKVSSLYYAADRKYNVNRIITALNQGYNVILDRYVYSNMAHQGGKIDNFEEREKMYEWISSLEFDLLELPVPDIKIFLHMPLDAALKLKAGRKEEADQNEKNMEHLINAEKAYVEVAAKYQFDTIECVENDRIKTIDEIHSEIMNLVKEKSKVLKKD